MKKKKNKQYMSFFKKILQESEWILFHNLAEVTKIKLCTVIFYKKFICFCF